MPNRVRVNGEEYFVNDIYTVKNGTVKYLLDNGKWVKAENCEVID